MTDPKSPGGWRGRGRTRCIDDGDLRLFFFNFKSSVSVSILCQFPLGFSLFDGSYLSLVFFWVENFDALNFFVIKYLGLCIFWGSKYEALSAPLPPPRHVCNELPPPIRLKFISIINSTEGFPLSLSVMVAVSNICQIFERH